MLRRTVITGGPGTGKTALVKELEKRGHYCFHEIIRDMTLSAKKEEQQALVNPLAFVKDPLSFNRILLKGRIDQYKRASKLQVQSVFYDRGIPDVLAYMDYFDQMYDEEFTGPCQDYRYDSVIVLPPWKAIYQQDNERMESFEEACAIHQTLEETYKSFDYTVRTIPFGTIENRVDHLLDILGVDHE